MRTSPRRSSLAILAAFAVFGLFWGAFAALLPDLKVAAGVTDAQLGIGFFALGIAALPTILATGRLVDRRSWPTPPVAMLGFAAAALLPVLAVSFGLLLVTFALIGAAAGVVDAVANTRVAELEAGGRRLMQVAHGVNAAGVVVGALATGAARAAGLPLVWPLAVVAAFGLIAAMLNVDGRRRRVAAPDGSQPGWRQLPLASVVGLGGLFAVAEVVESSADAWSAIHLEETLGGGAGVGGLGPAAFAGALIAGRLAAQLADARIGDRSLLVAGSLVAAVGMAVVAAAPGPSVGVAGLAIAGCGYAVVVPIIYRLAAAAVDERQRATAIGAVATVGATGYMVGPAVIGGVAGLADLRLGFGVLAAAALALSVGGLLVSREPRPR